MTDVNNDRGQRDVDGRSDDDQRNDGGQTPPPLVPPPVRRNDTGEQVGADREQARPMGADEPVFVEPTTARNADDAATPTTTTSGREDDEDADDDRDIDSAEQPYQPVSARSHSDDSAYAPVATRSADTSTTDASSGGDRDPARPAGDTAARDVETARQDVRDTSADAETVAVAAPSTSPSAPPQPVFVPASDGGTERATGFPPATGQQREFVQPPVAPKKKGNRGVGSLIALLSVILFAVVYALVAAAIIAAQEPQSLTDIFTNFVGNPLFWVPAIIFVIAFIIVVLLANRATWWAYVLGSLLVGALVYFGTIGVALLGDNVVGLSPSDAFDRFLTYVPNPFIIAAGLVAREVSLWTGSAIAARGRRVKERNVTAKDEYERATAEHRAEYERSYSPAG